MTEELHANILVAGFIAMTIFAIIGFAVSAQYLFDHVQIKFV